MEQQKEYYAFINNDFLLINLYLLDTKYPNLKNQKV